MKKIVLLLNFMFLILLSSCNFGDRYYDICPVKVGDSKEVIYEKKRAKGFDDCNLFGKYIIFSLNEENVSFIVTLNEELCAENIEAFKKIKTTKRKINSLKTGEEFFSCVKKVGLPVNVKEYEDKLVVDFIEYIDDRYVEIYYYTEFQLNDDGMYYLI